MEPLSLITVCITVCLGATAITSIIIKNMVKLDRIVKLENDVDRLRNDYWEKFAIVAVLESKLDSITGDIQRILKLLEIRH